MRFIMKITTNPVRGTYDYAPKQAEFRERVRRIIMNGYMRNGFSLITTPILENLSLLNGSDGGDNLRLMFKTIKRGEKLDLTKPNLTENDIVEEGLRYDLTVPLARFYANNKEQLPSPFKSIQIDYSFRAERPQKGRDRQFVQCDIDEFGDESVNAEIDVLMAGMSSYEELGFKELTIKINSKEILNNITSYCGYDQTEANSVCVSLDKIDKIGLDGVLGELNEKFNDDRAKKLITVLSDIKENGLEATRAYCDNDEAISRLKTLISTLTEFYSTKGVNYKFLYDVSIVRGQGYYTGVVYEVYAPNFRGAIGGGGRYDKMIEKLIGVKVPAVGFSIGFVPVCMLLEEMGVDFKMREKLALIYDDSDFNKALFYRRELMDDYDVSLYKRPKNMKAFLDKIKFVGFDAFIMFDAQKPTQEIKGL